MKQPERMIPYITALVMSAIITPDMIRINEAARGYATPLAGEHLVPFILLGVAAAVDHAFIALDKFLAYSANKRCFLQSTRKEVPQHATLPHKPGSEMHS